MKNIFTLLFQNILLKYIALIKNYKRHEWKIHRERKKKENLHIMGYLKLIFYSKKKEKKEECNIFRF